MAHPEDLEPKVKLNELSYDEMLDVARRCVPGITREQFQTMWDENVALLAAREASERQRSLH